MSILTNLTYDIYVYIFRLALWFVFIYMWSLFVFGSVFKQRNQLEDMASLIIDMYEKEENGWRQKVCLFILFKQTVCSKCGIGWLIKLGAFGPVQLICSIYLHILYNNKWNNMELVIITNVFRIWWDINSTERRSDPTDDQIGWLVIRPINSLKIIFKILCIIYY